MGIFRKLEKAMFGIDRDLEKRGVKGTAMINGVNETNTEWNESSVFDFTLTVTVEGREPYQMVHRQDGHADAGTEIAVFVDPANPQNLLIDWDSTWEKINAGRVERQLVGVDQPPIDASPKATLDWQLRNGHITQTQYDQILKYNPDLV